jgi:hypothetical protein
MLWLYSPVRVKSEERNVTWREFFEFSRSFSSYPSITQCIRASKWCYFSITVSSLGVLYRNIHQTEITDACNLELHMSWYIHMINIFKSQCLTCVANAQSLGLLQSTLAICDMTTGDEVSKFEVATYSYTYIYWNVITSNVYLQTCTEICFIYNHRPTFSYIIYLHMFN